jgi:hypothetical protein
MAQAINRRRSRRTTIVPASRLMAQAAQELGVTLQSYHDLIARKAVAFTPRGLDRIPSCTPICSRTSAPSTEFALRAGSVGHVPGHRARQVVRRARMGPGHRRATNKPVLMLAPLAVGPQHEREAERFGIDAKYIRDGRTSRRPKIYITNYERLDNFVVTQFAGVILDESSVIKSFSGKTTRS